MKMIEILWRDAGTWDGEYDVDRDGVADPGSAMHDVGQLVKIDRGFVTIALENYPESTSRFRHVMDIPFQNIIEIHELKRKKKIWPVEEKNGRDKNIPVRSDKGRGQR